MKKYSKEFRERQKRTVRKAEVRSRRAREVAKASNVRVTSYHERKKARGG